jgi:replicative DNA helicase
MLDKIPPQAIETERSLLARIIMDNSVMDDISFLSTTDFYRTAHQTIYRHMLKMANEEQPIDLDTLFQSLKSDSVPISQPDNWASSLAELIDKAPLAINPEAYARIIQEKAIRRHIMRVANEVFKYAQDETLDIEYAINEAQTNIVNIDLKQNTDNMSLLADSIKKTMDRLEMLQSEKGNITGIPSGYIAADHITGGFQKSDLIILAARPAMGKTAFAINILDNVTAAGHASAIFSIEMPETQLVNRMLARHSQLNGNRFKSGGFSSSEWQRINNAAGKIYNNQLIINDSSDMHYNSIRREARKYKKEHDIKLVVVDYMQLIKGDRVGNREQEVSSISRNMKAMARELNIPVICLAQLNRDLEKRGDKRPLLSDLRESGSIEQDADIVCFLYRDIVYNEKTENPKSAELSFKKHRNGMTGTINLEFTEELTYFYEPSTI